MIKNSGREKKLKTNILAKTAHATNLRKFSKPLAICISALFIISMVISIRSINSSERNNDICAAYLRHPIYLMQTATLSTSVE